MRSIALLLGLISLISQIRCEELNAKQTVGDKLGVKYAGPIVYTNEKPPIVYFPTPPTTSSTEVKPNQLNGSLRNSIEYVPFPYQELPVLIYKSKDNPPLHVVSDNGLNNSTNQVNANIEKRLGETNVGNSQRGGRALKWSNFKLFNDMPLVMKAPKWTNADSIKTVSVYPNSFTDISNKTQLNAAANTPLSMASAPHVIYSGHPPIHVFPQPIIIKEPEMSAEMTAASEMFQSLKKPNLFDISMSASNKHEISTNPSSSQFYSYAGTPLGSGGGNGGKSYGFRVKTRGNKHDTDYSGSQNYDNYDESYSPQHSDGSSESSQLEDKFKPSTHFSNSGSSSSSDSSSDQNEKDFDKLSESYGRERSREKFPKYETSSNWMDVSDVDNGWLSSLLGYNRWPRPPPRRPMAFMNSPNEHMLYASSHTNPMGLENQALMYPHMRPNPHWMTGLNGMRPTASAIRPVYTLSSLFGYRRPPMAAPATHYLTRLNPSLSHPNPNMSPMAIKSAYGGLSPQMMGLPSVSYPVKVPYSPFMMYGLRRPMGVHWGGSDLAFAESTRNTSNSVDSATKWANNFKEDIQMSGSHVQPTYVLPNADPTAKSISASTAQNKPPIIIYQGLRPPVHVYKQPNLTVRDNSETQQNLLSALQQLEAMKNSVSSDVTTDSTTAAASTENPYYQFYSTEEAIQSYDDNSYKTGSSFYINDNSAFSPRHSSGEWVPIKQSATDIKDIKE